MNERISKLYKELGYLLNHAPAVDDCTAKENEVYSDMANLKNSIENLFNEGNNIDSFETDIPDSCRECMYTYVVKRKYGETIHCEKEHTGMDVTHVPKGKRSLLCPLERRK